MEHTVHTDMRHLSHINISIHITSNNNYSMTVSTQFFYNLTLQLAILHTYTLPLTSVATALGHFGDAIWATPSWRRRFGETHLGDGTSWRRDTT